MEEQRARDVALVLLHECNDEIAGKTLLQKLAYFLSVREDLDLGFEPHFFGPFSRELEQEVEMLVLSELAMEETTVLGTSRAGSQISNTRYELTKAGQQTAELAVQHNDVLAKDAKEIASILRQSGALSTRRISLAAKVHFILESRQLPLTSGEIAAKAHELGWRVGEGDVIAASEILGDLGLVTG